MNVGCFKQNVQLSSDSDIDGDDDINLEILKRNEVLSAVNMCRCYIMPKVAVKKLLIQ